MNQQITDLLTLVDYLQQFAPTLPDKQQAALQRLRQSVVTPQQRHELAVKEAKAHLRDLVLKSGDLKDRRWEVTNAFERGEAKQAQIDEVNTAWEKHQRDLAAAGAEVNRLDPPPPPQLRPLNEHEKKLREKSKPKEAA
jgi:hypothetical protein